MTECGRQVKLDTYSSFREFNSNVIQFGYLAFFSGTFPAAALLAWLNNINEVRIDADKLVRYCRRPPLYHVKGVRVWVDALKVMAYTGMMVNILMLGLSSFSLRKYLDHVQPLNTFSYFPHLHPRQPQAAPRSQLEEPRWQARLSCLPRSRRSGGTAETRSRRRPRPSQRRSAVSLPARRLRGPLPPPRAPPGIAHRPQARSRPWRRRGRLSAA